VVAGTIAAAGPQKAFAFYGPFNLLMWGEVSTTLTTTAGSAAASVSSGTGIAAGQTVVSTNVPPGTTWGAFSGTSGTLAFPVVDIAGTSQTNATITGMETNTNLLGAYVSGTGIVAGTKVVDVSTPGQVTLSASPTTTQTGVFTFSLGPQSVVTGSDASAIFESAAWSATVQLERSFDGGKKWFACNIGGLGTVAAWNGSTQAGVPVSLVVG
jgi:hypothetical protein